MRTPFKNKNLDESKKMLEKKLLFFKSGINPEIEKLIYSTL